MPHKFIIAGGGTGGHIFPAIAIANGIKQREPDADILFVGAKGRMEMDKVPSAGFKIIGLNISGLKRSLNVSNFLVPLKLFVAILKASKIIKEFKPDIAIGVGGYASSALLYAATKKRIPTLIQEQNSYAGITNKILGQRVNKVCVAYEGMERFFPSSKIVITGNPVRNEILSQEGKKEKGLLHFNLNPEKFTILVIGGSLGAFSINQAIEKNLKKLHENGVQLIWQTGTGFYTQAREALAKFGDSSLQAFDFIKEMDMAYAVSDLIVSRAGAIAVSELCLIKKPSILIPYPHAAEDHQTHNAMALVNHGAAIMIKDTLVRDQLGDAILNLYSDRSKRDELIHNIELMGRKNATQLIVNEIFDLIG